MKPPEVHYAKNADVHIAYAVVGDGPIDLVYTTGIFSNLDVMWEEPRWARYLDRLASFSRLIVFDMRGVGLSDRGPEPPLLELQMDDVRAVMDAARSETAATFGGARGGAMTILFAATYPERVRGLILYDTLAKTIRSDDHPYGQTPEEQRRFFARFVAEMGTGKNLDLQGRSAAQDERFRRWWARFERLVATPTAYRELADVFRDLDIRSVLPSIQAPTLVLHRTGDPIIPVDQAHYLAKAIPNARLVELPGVDHLPFLGDQDAIVDEVEEFLTGARPAPRTDRVLATVLFTDIVGSTGYAARVGDREWGALLEQHHALVRKEIERYLGREIDNAGDGFFATFDGPARAIRCAEAVVEGVRDLGIEIRAGVHTGECELIDGKIGGITVSIGARVAATAGASEVRVSQTVKDLVAGSGLTFEDAGDHELKGVPDRWRLYRVMS